MKKNREKRVIQEGSKQRVLIILGFILASCFLVVGIVLMGVYFKNFDIYVKLANYWQGGPGFNEYINSHNSNYASYKSDKTSTWVYAGYSLFATGLSFALIGIIGISLLCFAYSKNKKKYPGLSLKKNNKRRIGNEQSLEVVEERKPVKPIIIQGPNV